MEIYFKYHSFPLKFLKTLDKVQNRAALAKSWDRIVYSRDAIFFKCASIIKLLQKQHLII